MEQEFDTSSWDEVVARLGSREELERSARECGAFERRREIRDAETLLRLCLAYGCGLSLRETSAWAGMLGIATLSDVAVLNRIRGSADWLNYLVGEVVARRLPSAAAARRVRIVDGSMVSGPDGTLYRLHAAYDLAERRFTHLELTDHKEAEKLDRTPNTTDEIRIGDRCFAKPEGVRNFCANGGDFIVRIGWKSLYLCDPQGGRLDLAAKLGEVSSEAPFEMAVAIRNGRKRSLPPIPARLIIIKKDEKAAQASRKRARRQSQRCGSAIQPATLRAADYVMLVTSLDAATYSAAEVAALYRLRWQIELAFKRLKSLFDFSRLPARDTDLARAWLLAKLLMALILEDVDRELPDSPPWANGKASAPLDLETHQDALEGRHQRSPRQPHSRSHQNPSAMVATRTRRTSPKTME
jgi:DDE family transposase